MNNLDRLKKLEKEIADLREELTQKEYPPVEVGQKYEEDNGDKWIVVEWEDDSYALIGYDTAYQNGRYYRVPAKRDINFIFGPFRDKFIFIN